MTLMMTRWQKRLSARKVARSARLTGRRGAARSLDAPRAAALLAVCLAWITACGGRSSLLSLDLPSDGDGGAQGAGSGEEDAGVLCAPDPERMHVLKGRLRDFSSQHPDFESVIAQNRGIVLDHLDAMGKPIYAGLEGNPTTSGKENFDQWYRDVPGVNEGKDISLPLTPTVDGIGIDEEEFFPIDGQLLGNEGRAHNFHFTFEAHTTFRYDGPGSSMAVAGLGGDEDVFIFINGSLYIDFAGSQLGTSNDWDTDTNRGKVFPIDIFFAQRHTGVSILNLVFSGFNLCE